MLVFSAIRERERKGGGGLSKGLSVHVPGLC